MIELRNLLHTKFHTLGRNWHNGSIGDHNDPECILGGPTNYLTHNVILNSANCERRHSFLSVVIDFDINEISFHGNYARSRAHLYIF